MKEVQVGEIGLGEAIGELRMRHRAAEHRASLLTCSAILVERRIAECIVLRQVIFEYEI